MNFTQCPDFVILDFETTGLDPTQAEIIEIGALKISEGKVVDRYTTLVRSLGEVPPQIAQITGITDEMLNGQPELHEVAAEFSEFVGELPIVAHNSSMELKFLQQYLAHHLPSPDSLESRVHNSIWPIALILPDHGSHSLEALRTWAGISGEEAHRALPDCEATWEVLEKVIHHLANERKKLIPVFKEFLPSEYAWWSWIWAVADDEVRDGDALIASTRDSILLKALKREPLGDLREMKEADSEREGKLENAHFKELDPQVKAAFTTSREGVSFTHRPQQVQMAREILGAFAKNERIAIEAPTGTGKSLAYLIPATLAAREQESPVVLSTHSKALQDQLFEKDIPLAEKILGGEPIRATTVKGQENYICLRKLFEAASSLAESATLEERWSLSLLVAFASVSRLAELDRISTYLKTIAPGLDEWIDWVRSNRWTTEGPTCAFYKTCHFFDSARLAHQSDIIVANHALVSSWPGHLPAIREIVFDEAHHLENQLTKSFSTELSEAELTEVLDRFVRKRGAAKISDMAWISRAVAPLPIPEPVKGRFDGDPESYFTRRIETIRNRLAHLRSLIPLKLPQNREGSEGYEMAIDLSLPMNAEAFTVLEMLQEVFSVIAEVSETLGIARDAAQEAKLTGSALDNLKTYSDRFDGVTEKLRSFISLFAHWRAEKKTEPSEKPIPSQRAELTHLRLLHWHTRELDWRVTVTPIDVSQEGREYFDSLRSVVLTSATLSSGSLPHFLTDRIGIQLAKPLIALPSPYQLEKQAVAFIPGDIPIPGTAAHLDSLIRFTEDAVRKMGGRTLLLVTSNRRLTYAAEILRERLKGDAIEVFDSVSDRRAADHFKKHERALLIGSERLGEGLDIPGKQLSLVIIEKIHEGMTRGALADERKARTRFPVFDYDYPLRMIWLKQRVGRLIRSTTDRGAIVIFDSRFHKWSPASRNHVIKAVAPIPIAGMDAGRIIQELDRFV